MTELFNVGDTVVYQDDFTRTPTMCRVTRVMPSERAGSHYHIRDLNENFERAVPGHTLRRDTSGRPDDIFTPAGITS